MLEASIATALTFIFLFTYLGIRRVAGYAWIIDISLFVLFLWLFKGTYAGMMTGILAGLIVTIFLKVVRRTLGYQVVRLHRAHDELVPRPRWRGKTP